MLANAKFNYREIPTFVGLTVQPQRDEAVLVGTA